MEVVENILIGIIVLVILGCCAIFVGAAVGVIPTAPSDPCKYGGTGKTAARYHHGWITVADRPVWCGP